MEAEKHTEVWIREDFPDIHRRVLLALFLSSSYIG